MIQTTRFNAKIEQNECLKKFFPVSKLFKSWGLNSQLNTHVYLVYYTKIAVIPSQDQVFFLRHMLLKYSCNHEKVKKK